MHKFEKKIQVFTQTRDEAIAETEHTKSGQIASKQDELIFKALKEARATNDLREMLAAEKACMSLDVSKTIEEKKSKDKAKEQYDYAIKSIDLVEDKNSYKKAYMSYNKDMKDASDLPIDGARAFISSQLTRVRNNLAFPSPRKTYGEVEIDKQRGLNLQDCKNIYIQRQKEALEGVRTIPEKEMKALKQEIKSQDLER